MANRPPPRSPGNEPHFDFDDAEFPRPPLPFENEEAYDPAATYHHEQAAYEAPTYNPYATGFSADEHRQRRLDNEDEDFNLLKIIPNRLMPGEFEEEPKRSNNILIAAVLIGVAIAGAGVYAFLGRPAPTATDNGTPIVAADSSPYKVKPTTPGGMTVPNQDKTVYDRIQPPDASKSAPPTVESLLPPPAAPAIPPAAPSATPSILSSTVAPQPLPTAPPAPAAPPNNLLTNSTPPAAPVTAPSALSASMPAVANAPTVKVAGAAPLDAPTTAPATQPTVQVAQASLPPPASVQATVQAAVPAAPPVAPPVADTAPPLVLTPAPGTSTKPLEKPASVVKAAPVPTPKAPVAVVKPTPKMVAVQDSPQTPSGRVATQVGQAPAVAGGVMIQLGALRSNADAKETWAKLRAKFPDALKGVTMVIQEADLGSKGVFYRLRGSGIASEQAAHAICAELAKANQGCLFVGK